LVVAGKPKLVAIIAVARKAPYHPQRNPAGPHPMAAKNA
jgi:hypothetical protein